MRADEKITRELRIDGVRRYTRALIRQIPALRPDIPPLEALAGLSWAVYDVLIDHLSHGAKTGTFEDDARHVDELLTIIHEEATRAIASIRQAMQDPQRPSQGGKPQLN